MKSQRRDGAIGGGRCRLWYVLWTLLIITMSLSFMIMTVLADGAIGGRIGG